MKIYCDGGSRGNPGPAASAFVVVNENDDTVYKKGQFIGTATNNVAEYNALILALSWVLENASGDVEIVLDSELVKKQMTGEYRIKDLKMKSLASEAKSLERRFSGKVTYVHTKREGNKEADSLVNSALDKKYNV